MVNPEQLTTTQPLWKVGAPRQSMMLTVTGKYQPSWIVPVMFPDGTGFEVEIAAQDFNPDMVRTVIEDHVNRVTAIRALEGPPI